MGKKEEKVQEFTLNELLLRRKEVALAAAHRKTLFGQANLFKENLRRTPVRHEGAALDQVVGVIPRMKKSQVEEETNYFSQKLREVDEVIQQQNFSLDVTGPASIFADFSSDKEKLEEKSKGTVTKKLAAFLTRRKSLNELCRSNLSPEPDDLLLVVDERLNAGDGVEKLREKAEEVTATEALAKADFYHRQLRAVDEAIHNANNGTKLKAPASLMQDFA
jgi:hypothetical protein